MTRDGHRGVIGEGIEDRGVETWDLKADEAEVRSNRGEGGVFCVVALIMGKMNVPHSKGAANSQGHLQGDGVLSEVDLVVVAGDHMIPGATAPVSSQPTGAYAPNMRPGGRRGGLLKGPTEDYMRGMAEPLMEIVVDNKPLRALVDTRATYPTETRGTITDKDLSDKTVGVMGFFGGLEHWPMTKQLTVQVVNQSLPY